MGIECTFSAHKKTYQIFDLRRKCCRIIGTQSVTLLQVKVFQTSRHD